MIERLRGATRAEAAFTFPSVPIHFRRAAVLLMVWADAGGDHLVVTERGSHLRSHAGQVSLPGGRIDPGESAFDAAVRETVEELGVDPTCIEVVGRLDDAWSAAGNHIVPVVAWHHGEPCFFPNADEVSRIGVVDLEPFGPVDAVPVLTPIGERISEQFDAGDLRVVGLTADIVLELVGRLGGGQPGRGRDRWHALERFLEAMP
jgi:8-oxo-dGTP pyrophosphatase MutT (NUDIX family)